MFSTRFIWNSFDVSFGTYLSVYVFVNEGFSLSTQQGAYLAGKDYFIGLKKIILYHLFF